jgi:hypothetical protein
MLDSAPYMIKQRIYNFRVLPPLRGIHKCREHSESSEACCVLRTSGLTPREWEGPAALVEGTASIKDPLLLQDWGGRDLVKRFLQNTGRRVVGR